MPPEIAPAAAPTVAPSVAAVIPAAAEPSADKPWKERWAAAGGDDADDAADDDEPIEGAPAAPPAGKAPAAAKPAADKRGQFEALAKELGFSLDGNAVTVAERAEFRRAREKREADWATRERAISDKEKLTPEDAEFARIGRALLDAKERGDPDAFAQALKAKDFNEFQQDFIKRLADPNYGELRKLQAKVEEGEKLKLQQEEQAKQNATSQARARAYQTYMSTLSETCKASADPLIAEMHDDPLFLQAIYNIQEQNWDPDLGKTCTAEEAIARAAKGAAKPLKDEMRQLYEKLHKAFGGGAAAAEAGSKGSNGKRPAPKTAVTPKNTTGSSGAPKSVSEMVADGTWAEYKKKKFAEVDD